MVNILITCIFAQVAFLSIGYTQQSIEGFSPSLIDPSFKGIEEAIRSPDFPMSEAEVRETLRNIDHLMPTMQSASDIRFTWTLDKLNEFDLFNEALKVSKGVDVFTAMPLIERPSRLKAYNKKLISIIAHEYGHAVLNRNLLLDSPHAARFFEDLQSSAKRSHRRTVPTRLHQHTLLFLAYHELFADTLAFMQSGDPKVIKAHLDKIFGPGMFGNIYYRQFLYPPAKSHHKLWNSEMGKQSLTGNFNYYALFWPVRTQIAELYKSKKLKPQEILYLLYKVIIEESRSLTQPDFKIDPMELNRRFSEQITKRAKTLKAEFRAASRSNSPDLTCSKLFSKR